MQKRMHFEGIEQITEAFQAGRSCSVYLGHYCNWEWISSLPMHLGNAGISAQIYHPLENKAFDQLSYTCADASELHPYKWTTLSEPF